MISKMFTSEVIAYLKKRGRLLRDIKEARVSSSVGYSSVVEELEKGLPPCLYLEEDCILLTGGGLKRGHLLTLEEASLLWEYGFYMVWVTDEAISEEDKKRDILYYYKTEIENILTKAMVIIDEKVQGRKPGSAISYIESNDLLKQTIEPLQLDGAKYIHRYIFGETGKRFDALSQIFAILFNKDLGRFGLFDQNCMGNLWLVKQRKRGVVKGSGFKNSKEKVRSNFVLRSMINIALSFVVTVKNIQSIRKERGGELRRGRDLLRRVHYTDDELMEASLSALFAEYGYLHKSIDSLILNLTDPYYSDDGRLEGGGFVFPSDGEKLILDKHSNVSNYLFSSVKEKGFVRGEIGKDILRNHHRYLNGTGYPKRKVLDEKVFVKDGEGNVSIRNRKVFDSSVLELTRLVGIISFFVDSLSHTPFHIPFQRDSLVRHVILNSVYNKLNNKPDEEGVYDFKVQYRQEKKFDAYLLDMFLSSIVIYKIGEKVPIYNFNNSKLKLYDAEVISYNRLPHRPVVKVVWSASGDNLGMELDLSGQENAFIYIGEYIPSLVFQDVVDKFYLDAFEGGISIEDVYQNTYEDVMESEGIMDSFDSGDEFVEGVGGDVVSGDEVSDGAGVGSVLGVGVLSASSGGGNDVAGGSLFSVFVESGVDVLPYGLGELIASGGVGESYRIKYMAECVNETDRSYTYRYVLLGKGEEEIVNVGFGGGPRFVVKGSYDNVDTVEVSKGIVLGSCYMLYYNPAKDVRNRDKELLEGGKSLKYVVCVKEHSASKLIVQFIRYLVVKGGVTEYVRDQNCGKHFDLLKMPFFELGNLLSSVDLSNMGIESL